FPWAAVFGKATQLAAPASVAAGESAGTELAATRLEELGVSQTSTAKGENVRQAARDLALTSLADIGVFFGGLLVGFAYVWKRGDLDWVRTVGHERVEPIHRPPLPRAVESSHSILSA